PPPTERRWASVCALCAAPPSLPRGICRWRERRRLLASGGRLAFPGDDTQWRLSRYDLPVTVAGPRRIRSGLRESPFACNYGARVSNRTLRREPLGENLIQPARQP